MLWHSGADGEHWPITDKGTLAFSSTMRRSVLALTNLCALVEWGQSGVTVAVVRTVTDRGESLRQPIGGQCQNAGLSVFCNSMTR